MLKRKVDRERGGRTAKSESQAQKYSKRSAAEKVHISRCHFLDFGNLAFKLGPGRVGLRLRLEGRKCTQRCHHHIMGVFVGVAVHINTLQAARAAE